MAACEVSKQRVKLRRIINMSVLVFLTITTAIRNARTLWCWVILFIVVAMIIHHHLHRTMKSMYWVGVELVMCTLNCATQLSTTYNHSFCMLYVDNTGPTH